MRFDGFRLLSVHAHPDDESSKGAATVAKYADLGAEVLVVSCTGGERGDVLNPRLQNDPNVINDLPAIRRQEMDEAAKALGILHHWLGFVDSGLPEGDPLPPLPQGCFALEPLEVPTEALVRVIRDFRPHVMLTYNEMGGYPHPDHIRTHEVSMAAREAAADPQRFASSGSPWQISKVYYDCGFSAERLTAVHEAMEAEGLESPFAGWLSQRSERPARVPTAFIDAADYFAARDRALLAHATQIDPDGFFFAVPRELERRVWPTEEFELAYSEVPTEVPEHDLFAGIQLEDLNEAGQMTSAIEGS